MNEEKEKKIRKILDESRFVPLTNSAVKKLDFDEYLCYLKTLRLYNYINNIPTVDYDKSDTYSLSHLILYLNRNLIDHQKFKIINNKMVQTDKPILYCISHIGKFDYQIVYEAIKDYAIPFAGDPETLVRRFDGYFLERNQVVYCDVYDSLDKYVGEKAMIDLLKHNCNGLIYPEGFWNVTSNELIMPLYPGAIRIAMLGGAEIVPVCIEKYGKSFYLNIEKNIKLDGTRINDQEYIEAKKEELRDIMATSKYELFNNNRLSIRSELGSYEELEKEFQDSVFNEYLDKDKKPIFSMATVEERRYKPKDPLTGYRIQSPKEAFSYLESIKINKNNAFMFRQDLSIPKYYQEALDEKYQEALEENLGAQQSIQKVKKLLE